MALAEPADLFVGDPHLLETIRHQLAGALERAEILDGRLDRGTQLFDPPHPRRHFGGDPVEPTDLLPQRRDPLLLLQQPAQLRGQLARLLAHAPHLGGDRCGALAGGIEHGEPALTLLHRVPEVGHPLAHRVQAPVLQLEALAALPHLLPEIVERLPGGLLRLLGLGRHLLQLLGAPHDLGLHRVDLGDLGLDLAEAADLLLLPTEPRVQLAVEPGELADLGRGAIDGLALLLQRRRLLRHLVGQGLEHRQPVLEIGHRGDRLADRLERALHHLHAAGGLVEPGRDGLVLLVEVLQPRRAVPVGAKRVVGLGAHPGDVLAHLVELFAQALGAVRIAPMGPSRLRKPSICSRNLRAASILSPNSPSRPCSWSISAPAPATRWIWDSAAAMRAWVPSISATFCSTASHRSRRAFISSDRSRTPLRARSCSIACSAPGDERLEGERDVRSAGIDGDDCVVRAAAAFEEGDHGVAPGARLLGGEIAMSVGTVQVGATGMPEPPRGG